MAEAKEEYVNWLYFTRFESEQLDEDKCVGDHELFYDSNINAESGSSVFIYGCLTRTNKMNVDHMTDIYFTDNECKDGYFRASQDLNEGNEGSIFMCYDKVESKEENGNLAILGLTFVADGDVSRLDGNAWALNEVDDVNPSGLSLKFAVQKGAYLEESASLKGSAASDDGEGVSTAATAEGA